VELMVVEAIEVERPLHLVERFATKSVERDTLKRKASETLVWSFPLIIDPSASPAIAAA
jgi:hypothetical protein